MRTGCTHDRPRGRTLHLIDLENLAGSPYATVPELAVTLHGYRSLVTVCEDDHAVIALNPYNTDLVFAAHDLWFEATTAGCQIKVARGKDGADGILLDACGWQRMAERYDRVMFGSGDHAFATPAGDLRRRGLVTGVVSRRSALAAALRVAASFHRFLPETNRCAALPAVAA